ncbi:hypothetical protein Tco_0511610 [Tanacetum coccineum]
MVFVSTSNAKENEQGEFWVLLCCDNDRVVVSVCFLVCPHGLYVGVVRCFWVCWGSQRSPVCIRCRAQKVGLQVALRAPTPATITPEASRCHVTTIVLIEDREALNNVPVRDCETYSNSLWCFAGARGCRGNDLEHGGENVIRAGDFEQGGKNVNRGGDLVFFCKGFLQ